METKYYLISGFLKNKARVEIDQRQYEEILDATEIIRLLFEQERRFSLLTDSYLDTEAYLMRATLEFAFERERLHDKTEIVTGIERRLNLLLISFFSCARIYIDKSVSLLNEISKITGDTFSTKQHFREQYDNSFEYRLCYHLRNYVLHNDLPLSNLSLSVTLQKDSERSEEVKASRERYTVDPLAVIEQLRNDTKINSKLGSDLDQINETNISLRFVVRGYVHGLAKAQEKIRFDTAETLQKSSQTIMSSHTNYAKVAGFELTRFFAQEAKNDCQPTEYSVDIENLLRLEEARRFGRILTSAQRIFVSNELVSDVDTFPQSDKNVWISD